MALPDPDWSYKNKTESIHVILNDIMLQFQVAAYFTFAPFYPRLHPLKVKHEKSCRGIMAPCLSVRLYSFRFIIVILSSITILKPMPKPKLSRLSWAQIMKLYRTISGWNVRQIIKIFHCLLFVKLLSEPGNWLDFGRKLQHTSTTLQLVCFTKLVITLNTCFIIWISKIIKIRKAKPS